MFELGAAVACGVFVVVCLYATWHANSRARALAKLSASICFIAIGLHGADSGELASLFVVVGLFLSGIGDAFLLGERRTYVLGGIVAFLLAHIAYTAAVVVINAGQSFAWLRALPVVPVAACAGFYVLPRAGRLVPAAAAYLVVISTMVAVALASSALSPLFMWGAISFFISDLFVARQRFIAAGIVNRLLGLPLYYAGQIAIAWSLAS